MYAESFLYYFGKLHYKSMDKFWCSRKILVIEAWNCFEMREGLNGVVNPIRCCGHTAQKKLQAVLESIQSADTFMGG